MTLSVESHTLESTESHRTHLSCTMGSKMGANLVRGSWHHEKRCEGEREEKEEIIDV